MNHPLYVGYLERLDTQHGFKIRKPIDMVDVMKVLSTTQGGRSENQTYSAPSIDPTDSRLQFVSRVGNEELYYKNGYLVCPWLGIDVNLKSVEFICRLFHECGCSIYDPEDGVFYTPDELRAMENEFYRV